MLVFEQVHISLVIERIGTEINKKNCTDLYIAGFMSVGYVYNNERQKLKIGFLENGSQTMITSLFQKDIHKA